MTTQTLYTEITQVLEAALANQQLSRRTFKRLSLLALGIIEAKSAAPHQIAQALASLKLSEAEADSIERRLRRIENDGQITAERCFHPLARQRLALGQPQQLLLIIDPTTQDDRVVMVTISVWYRGRALPLVWDIWPGNQPLTEAGFWERIRDLLNEVEPLLPVGVPVIWLADRAFGTPAFTDLVTAHGWDYLVRVQDQTRYQDALGREVPLRQLVGQPGQRAKGAGQVFKKRGWRSASVVVAWGRRYQGPLCLVSNRPAQWALAALYRRRFPIEATFRDYKSSGWQWERGQVVEFDHLRRLLVGLALATWLTLLAGSHRAAQILAKPATGHRRSRPWWAKLSLFGLGLLQFAEWSHGHGSGWPSWQLTDWEAGNWQTQIYAHHLHAFIFAARA